MTEITITYAKNFYSVIINKSGEAKAQCFPTIEYGHTTLRCNTCARNGNFFTNLQDAKEMAERINNLFKEKQWTS